MRGGGGHFLKEKKKKRSKNGMGMLSDETDCALSRVEVPSAAEA